MMDNTKKRLAIFLLLLIVGTLAGIFGYLNAKITTFEECEKAGLLVRSIRVYDGNGPIEAECVLWGGKSFVKEKSQEQRAVEIATAHLSFPVTIIEVKKLECQGCFSVKLQRDDNRSQFTIVLDNWKIKNVTQSGNLNITPAPFNDSQYFYGKAFDEVAGNLTKKWDATNFAGFWHDSETNVSTETLVIDQNILNNSNTVIEKHNLIYTTKSMPVKYQVYLHANQTPAGTDGFYQVLGWMGDKYVFLEGNKLAKIIFEQNTTDVKSIRIGESWNLEEGYRIVANSIDADGIMQAWISLDKDNTKIDDKVLAIHYKELYSYPQIVEGSDIPILVTYLSKIYSLPETDAADFKYTWLRSQNLTDVKEGDIFGVMEVTSVKNGTIELRNKDPINLASGNTILLMGNIGIQVGSSKTGLLFYPFKGGI